MPAKPCHFSPCGLYRYTLWREWDMGLFTAPPNSEKYLMVIGLNPSTADDKQDDPTIRRCIGFAKSWGYGSLCMTNLFAFRATDPKKMKAQHDPVGLENNQWLQNCANDAGMILAAWGRHGIHANRQSEVVGALKARGFVLKCLGKNKDGTPEHPLYIPGKTVPTDFTI